MSLLPLSHSTTSLSTTHSADLTDVSESTGYTSDGRLRDPDPGVKRISNTGGDGHNGVCSDKQEDEMEQFMLGPGWRDPRVPPAERLNHLYHLLQEHYDLTRGDYFGQNPLPVRGSSMRNTQSEGYLTTCIPYLTSIGVDFGSLKNSNDVSTDPMNDLINEAFRYPSSLPHIPKYRTSPVSTWELDWSRPPPATIHAYWEVMHRTRPKPAHEFTSAKPVVGAPHVNIRPNYRQEDFPRYYDVGKSVPSTGKKFRAVLHKVRGLVTSY